MHNTFDIILLKKSKTKILIQNFIKNFMYDIWRPLSLSELTPIIFNTGLTY